MLALLHMEVKIGNGSSNTRTTAGATAKTAKTAATAEIKFWRTRA
jgi:hypothetical protein